MTLKLVIFDLDGTLIDSPLNFDAIRAEIGLPDGIPILEALDSLSPAERARAERILDRHETEAVRASRLMPGAADLLAHLRARGVKTALLTRNSRTSIDAAARRHGLAFNAAVAREDHTPKPSPEGVRHLMAACGAEADETVLVGDFRFDIEAGAAAGVRTIAVAAQPTAWSALATWQAADLQAVRVLLDPLMAGG